MAKNSIRQAVDAAQLVQASAENQNAEETVWHQPIMFDSRPVPEIPANLLPGWLGDMATAVSKETQTPEGMAVMMALSTLATCVQKSVVVSPYGDGYAEPLNIWTATILPPASRKTSVVTAMTAPLLKWEKEASALATEQIIERETNDSVSRKILESLEREAAKESNEHTRSGIQNQINEIKQKLLAPQPVSPRIWTGDTTPEQLQNMLMDQGERMAVLSDEGGIFEVMTGLYTDGRANMDVFLQSHAGRSVRVDRGARNVTLEAPALTFGLAIQPAIVSELGSGNKRKLRGNGTLARFLFCFPDSNIGTRDLRRRTSLPEETRLRYETNLIHLLNRRRMSSSPMRLTLTPSALEAWLQFAESIEKRQGADGDLESIQDWSGKLSGACLRVAGLLQIAASDFDSQIIHVDIMDRAIELCRLLIPHAKRVFNVCSAEQSTEDAKYLWDFIQRKGKTLIKESELFELYRFKGGRKKRLLEAIASLRERNILGQRENVGKTKPSWVYTLNSACAPMLSEIPGGQEKQVSV